MAKDGDKNAGLPEETGFESEEHTRIDLGDDLLNEKTVMLTRAGTHPHFAPPRPSPGSAPEPPGPAEFDPADQIESAQILIAEGLFEDAKKILRKVLLHDAGNVQARQKLAEIHEAELRQIFNEQRPSRLRNRRDKAGQDLSSVDPEDVMRRLDRDLRLHALEETDAIGLPETVISLFGDAASVNRFADKLDRDLRDVPPKDRMDIGIAFLELGLGEVALRQFDAALDACQRETEPDLRLTLTAASLKAYALISQRRPFDAIAALDRYLTDPEVEDADKIDLIYLMGRAQEMTGMKLEARQWYLQVNELDPTYRDVKDRLKAK